MRHPLPLSLFSCAKINLSLDIVGLRADGYHELRSVVHTVALCDALSLRFDGSGSWRLRCDDASLQTPDNLCLKAARLWSQAAQAHERFENIGGEISLQKRIPHGAGLGGGSGNAWATLGALSLAYDPGHEIITRSQLHDLAKRLGADVPLFARGGALLLEGIGERVSALSALPAWIVLAQPRQIISTPAAFGAWDRSAKVSSEDTSALLEAWEGAATPSSEERISAIGARLGNDLRGAARSLGVPVEVGIEALRQAGAVGAEMTGSGSAVFGLCLDQAHAASVERQARRTLSHARHEPDGWRLWSAPLCDFGTQLQAGGEPGQRSG